MTGHIQPTMAGPIPLTSQIFPTLTAAQIARLAAIGRVREMALGDVLLHAGDSNAPFFVVTAGSIDVIRAIGGPEERIATHTVGSFTGEVNIAHGPSGAASRFACAEPGAVIEIDRDQLRDIIQTDAELGEILLRAFILRRVEIVARGIGDVVLVGSNHSPGTLRIKEFLSRNGHPYTYLDLDRDDERAGAARSISRRHQRGPGRDLPRLRPCCAIRRTSSSRTASASTKRWTARTFATWSSSARDRRGSPPRCMRRRRDSTSSCSRRARRAAKPASSSRIENYLGFPTGISGQELAGRAYTQAQKFGAQLMIARRATRLACEREAVPDRDRRRRVRSRARGHSSRPAREYRRLALPNLAQFEGAGVYYGATFVESQLCRGDELIVVGGANSAGQAAVFLVADGAARAHARSRRRPLGHDVSLPHSPHRAESDDHAAHADRDRRARGRTTTSSA